VGLWPVGRNLPSVALLILISEERAVFGVTIRRVAQGAELPQMWKLRGWGSHDLRCDIEKHDEILRGSHDGELGFL
jgi:hypothetical protein